MGGRIHDSRCPTAKTETKETNLWVQPVPCGSGISGRKINHKVGLEQVGIFASTSSTPRLTPVQGLGELDHFVDQEISRHARDGRQQEVR